MDEFDVVAAVVADSPGRIYCHVLQRPGMVWSESRGCWVAARPEDVLAVLTSDVCMVRPPGNPVPSALAGTAAGEVFVRFARMIDGERHVEVKRAVAEAMDRLDPAVAQAVSRHHATNLARQGDLDRLLVALPVSVVATLLGVPDASLPRMVSDTTCFVRAAAPGASVNDVSRGVAAAGRLRQDFMALCGQADVSPMHEALTGALAVEGHNDVETVVANAIGFLFQSHDATAGLIGNTLVRLVRHPETARTSESILALVANVALVDPAVHNTRRYAGGDVHVNGVDVRRGEEILVSLAAANIGDDRRSWSFGAGRHACPAQTLAMTIATAGVGAVCEQGLLPDRLPDPMRYRPLGNVRIPVFVDPS